MGVIIFIINRNYGKKYNMRIFFIIPLLIILSYFSKNINLLSDFLLGMAFSFSLLILINIDDLKNNSLKILSNFIAKISFSMYAIHLPFVVLILSFYTKGNILEFNFLSFLSYVLIICGVLIFSFIFWFLFERKTYLVANYLHKIIRR